MEPVDLTKTKYSNLHLYTPLLESTCLSKRLGFNVYLKLENTQPSGSFKIRGVGNRCRKLVMFFEAFNFQPVNSLATSHPVDKAAEKGFSHIVSSSGGNAGLAAAYAGRKLEMQVTVIVPETTSQLMIRKIKEEGASVEVMGKVWDEANSYAVNIAKKPGHFLVHPFDHEDIWEGHATMIKEIAESIPRKPSVIVVAVGGGGLLSGVLRGLHDVGWQDVPVVAMETEGANSFAAAVQAGKLVTLPGITSIAKCLGAKTVCEEAYKWTSRHRIISSVVSDKDAVTACLKFADEHQMVVSPSCGAALSAVYSNVLTRLKDQDKLEELTDVVVIVCGGSGVSLAKLQEWKDEFEIKD